MGLGRDDLVHERARLGALPALEQDRRAREELSRALGVVAEVFAAAEAYAREALLNPRVVRARPQRVLVGLLRRLVVEEDHFVELGGARPEPRLVVAGRRALGQGQKLLLERARVAADALEDRVDERRVLRIERPGVAQRGRRLRGHAEPIFLHVGARGEQRRARLLVLRVGDARRHRLVDVAPAPLFLEQAHEERARAVVTGPALEHLSEEALGPFAVRVGERLGGAHADLVGRGAVRDERGLLEERARATRAVARARGGPREPHDRAHALRLEGEDLLVRVRGAVGVAGQLLPQERDLLEVRDPSRHVLGPLRRARVHGDALAHALERVGRPDGRAGGRSRSARSESSGSAATAARR